MGQRKKQLNNTRKDVEHIILRKMKLEDHGVPAEDQNELLDRCRNRDEESDYILRQAIESAAPFIKQSIYDNLTSEWNGYDNQNKRGHIPVTRIDFLAYRRKAMAGYYRMLRLFGKW